MEFNFDRERDLLQGKRKELLDGVGAIDDALAALDRGPKANGKTKVSNGATAGAVVRARKPMSAKGKAAARQRMLAYWAAKRAAAAKPKSAKTKPAR